MHLGCVGAPGPVQHHPQDQVDNPRLAGMEEGSACPVRYLACSHGGRDNLALKACECCARLVNKALRAEHVDEIYRVTFRVTCDIRMFFFNMNISRICAHFCLDFEESPTFVFFKLPVDDWRYFKPCSGTFIFEQLVNILPSYVVAFHRSLAAYRLPRSTSTNLHCGWFPGSIINKISYVVPMMISKVV